MINVKECVDKLLDNGYAWMGVWVHDCQRIKPREIRLAIDRLCQPTSYGDVERIMKELRNRYKEVTYYD